MHFYNFFENVLKTKMVNTYQFLKNSCDNFILLLKCTNNESCAILHRFHILYISHTSCTVTILGKPGVKHSVFLHQDGKKWNVSHLGYRRCTGT